MAKQKQDRTGLSNGMCLVAGGIAGSLFLALLIPGYSPGWGMVVLAGSGFFVDVIGAAR